MILQKIHIYGFGKWQDQVFSLQAPLQWIQGDNESGKSTLKTCIEALLFGFDKGFGPNHPYFPLRASQVGGRLWVEIKPGQTYQVERLYQGDKATFSCRDQAGQTISLEEWQKSLGMTKDQYQAVFSMTLDQLTRFKLQDPKDINRYLYQIGLTGSDLWLAMGDKAQQEAQKLYTPKSSKRPLDHLGTAYMDKAQAWQTANQALVPYLEAKESLAQIQAQQALVQEEEAQLSQTMSRMEEDLTYLPHAQAYLKAQRQWNLLDQTRPLSALQALQSQIGELDRLKAQEADWTSQLSSLRQEGGALKASQVDQYQALVQESQSLNQDLMDLESQIDFDRDLQPAWTPQDQQVAYRILTQKARFQKDNTRYLGLGVLLGLGLGGISFLLPAYGLARLVYLLILVLFLGVTGFMVYQRRGAIGRSLEARQAKLLLDHGFDPDQDLRQALDLDPYHSLRQDRQAYHSLVRKLDLVQDQMAWLEREFQIQLGQSLPQDPRRVLSLVQDRLKSQSQGSEQAQIQWLSDQLVLVQDQIQPLESQVQAQIRNLGLQDPSQVPQAIDAYHSLDLEKDLHRQHLGPFQDASQEDLDFYQSQVQQIQADWDLNQAQAKDLATQAATLEERIRLLDQDLSLDAAQVDLDQAKQDLLQGMEDWLVYSLAAQLIQETLEKVSGQSYQVVQEEVSSIFQDLTQGDYSSVQFAQQSVRVKRKDDVWFLASQLSAGTRDLLYLSLRLAFLQVLGAYVGLPVLMDDVLVQVDYKRRQGALDYLASGKLQRQVLYFSMEAADYPGTIKLTDRKEEAMK